MDTRKEICTEAHVVTNSNTWREFKWKIITRFFRTPEITAKMDPTHSSSCWRNCGTQVANHTRVFWLCLKLSLFWREVYDALKEIFKQDISQSPTVALLGARDKGMDKRPEKYFLNILLYNYWMVEIGSSHIQCVDPKSMGPISDGGNYIFIKAPKIHFY